jgi:Raf kinase inhibitor-like YbhB/YbcL family protein
MTFALNSPAFQDGAAIPEAFSHESGDESPPLMWDGVPDGTRELVVLVDDPDAPIEGSFVHWVCYGIDPQRTALAAGEQPAEARSGENGFGGAGYLGPAPPPGPAHHYTFRLLALADPLSLDAGATYADVEAACAGHVLAEARLIGTFQET